MVRDSRRRIVWNVAVTIGVGLLFTTEVTIAQVAIQERVEIIESKTEFQAGTQTDTMAWNLEGPAAEVPYSSLAPCDVRVNDPTYIPCPTFVAIGATYYCPCDMDQGECGDPPYTWIASMINYDTSALTFTFQDELTYMEQPGVYYESSNAFAFNLALWSHNWFGVADATLTFHNADGPFCSWTGRLVIDDDNDLIADAWEEKHGGMEREMTRPLKDCSAPSDACWDDDGIDIPLLGGGKVGDGIPKIEEYRGIFLNGPHRRLDPDSQDVFVDVDLGYTNEANWALGQLKTQLGMKVHQIDDLDLVLQGAATIPWAGNESFAVFILLNDSSATNYISADYRALGGSDEQILELLNGYIVDQGTYYWGDVDWNDPSCVTVASSLDLGCQPWEAIAGGPRFGLTNRGNVAKKGVFVSTVYPSGFEAYFDAGRNSILEKAFLFFRYQPTTDPPLTEHDLERFWRSGYYGFDLNEDGDNDDDISPYELLNEPVDDEYGLPAINNDDVDGYVMESSFSESIRRTMLHELFHALSTPEYHPERGYSVMRRGPGPAKVDDFLTEDKREIDLRYKRGYWLVHHE